MRSRNDCAFLGVTYQRRHDKSDRYPGAADLSRQPRRSRSAIYRATGPPSTTKISRTAFPGPTSATTPGIPLNDAGRLKADSWDASILTLREHQAKPHPRRTRRGPANIRITTRARSGHAGDHRLRAVRDVRTGDAHDLAGRTFASSRACRAHVGRILDRPLGRQHTRRRTTHLKVGWLQRNGVAHSDRRDDDGALHPARRPT